MTENTAPFKAPEELIVDTATNFTIDVLAVENFNSKISICSVCERCNELNDRPGCSELLVPLAAAAERNNCPIGKW